MEQIGKMKKMVSKKRKAVTILLIAIIIISLVSTIYFAVIIDARSSGSSAIDDEIFIEDMNGDEKNDIVIECANLQEGNSIQVFDGNGNLIRKYGPIDVNYLIAYKKIDDVDGDGKDDVIMMCDRYRGGGIGFSGSSGIIYVFKNDGHLFWKYSTQHSLDWGGLEVVDITGDGKKDVIAVSYNKIIDLKNNGDFLWTTDIERWITTSGGMVKSGDVDGDELGEIVVNAGGIIYVIDNDGKILWEYANASESFTIYNMAGHKEDTILCINESSIISLGESGVVNQVLLTFKQESVWSVGSVDVDGDSINELIVSVGEKIHVFNNSLIEVWNCTRRLATIIRDMDNDEKYDTVTWGLWWDIIVYKDGESVLWSKKVDARGTEYVVVGDINDDGINELIVSSYPRSEDYGNWNGKLYLLKNDG